LTAGDSIADDIIEGMDRSSIVLVCLSQKYYESPYCRKGVCMSVINIVHSACIAIIVA